MVFIQRSCGYAWRPTFDVETLGAVIRAVKSARPDVICFVDNCFGEFAEDREPTHVGADLIAGSLIKNCGEKVHSVTSGPRGGGCGGLREGCAARDRRTGRRSVAVPVADLSNRHTTCTLTRLKRRDARANGGLCRRPP